MLVHNLRQTIIALSAIAFTGCQVVSSKPSILAQAKPSIVASHSILCHFVDAIAQDTVDLSCLIDGGQDPHTYRPSPSERKALEQAQIVFYGGYNLEPQLIDLIEAVDSDTTRIAVYEAVVTEPIMAEHHHHGHEEKETNAEHDHHDDHDHEEELEADPHIWHDVNNAIATVEYLQSELVQLNPAQAALYLENSAELIDQLKQLHIWIQEQIATIPEGQRTLVTPHSGFNYYVKTYELENYLTLQGLSPEDSPSAADVKNLVQQIRQTQVPTIFVETTANERVINTVAREAGVKISDQELLVDGLGELGTDTDTYIQMMVQNTCAIANGLEGNCQSYP